MKTVLRVFLVELIKSVVSMTFNISKGILMLLFLATILTAVVMGVPSVFWWLGVYPWVAFPAWWILIAGFMYNSKEEQLDGNRS